MSSLVTTFRWLAIVAAVLLVGAPTAPAMQAASAPHTATPVYDHPAASTTHTASTRAGVFRGYDRTSNLARTPSTLESARFLPQRQRRRALTRFTTRLIRSHVTAERLRFLRTQGDGGKTVDVLAGGARDLGPSQRGLAKAGEILARAPGEHAEVTALRAAMERGLQPRAIAATRDFCPACRRALEDSGAQILGPRTAVWGRR